MSPTSSLGEKNVPDISVIIACFNAEKYINDAISSVLNSSLQNFELIIVDDCSTDTSIKIVKPFLKDARVHLSTSLKNKGAAASRNIGINLAKSEYLFFLDADARVDSDALENAVRAFKNDQSLGGFQAHLLNAANNTTESLGHYLTFFGFPYEITEQNDLYKNIYILGAKTAGMGIRKKLCDGEKGFVKNYVIYGEDTELSWRIWLYGYTMKALISCKVFHHREGSLSERTKFRIYYYGAKNSTRNLLCLLSRDRMIFMLPLHTIAWLCIAVLLVIKNQRSFASQIVKGLWWNIRNVRIILSDRRKLRNTFTAHPLTPKVMYGSMTLLQLCHKGLKYLYHEL